MRDEVIELSSPATARLDFLHYWKESHGDRHRANTRDSGWKIRAHSRKAAKSSWSLSLAFRLRSTCFRTQGIGHTSWVPAQRPSMGVMLNP